MMENAKKLIEEYVNLAEEILVEFSVDEESALKKLSSLCEKLGEKKSVEKDYEELFAACTYNALATINTVPCLTKKSSQLISSLTEAKEEMRTIGEML